MSPGSAVYKADTFSTFSQFYVSILFPIQLDLKKCSHWSRHNGTDKFTN